MNQEKLEIANTDNCSYSYPHIWCDNPCQATPEPLALSDRVEELAQEEVFRDEKVPYTRPECQGVPYHVKRPDYRFFIVGLGWLSLETKNRNSQSWQGPAEARDCFAKESDFPIHYWGSYHLTEAARECVVSSSRVEVTFHTPVGFKCQENAAEWKERFRRFLRDLKNEGVRALQKKVRDLLRSTARKLSRKSAISFQMETMDKREGDKVPPHF